jgi:hypothetical protein
MRLLSRSLRNRAYVSLVRCASRAIPGVGYSIRRMSLARRIRLAEAIRDLAGELDFKQAGATAKEQVEAAALAAQIDLAYLRWGLCEITGLSIDGECPTAALLFESGPEDLLREIVDRIKRECGLSDDERKN